MADSKIFPANSPTSVQASPSASAGTRSPFPRKTALAVLTAAVLLYAWHRFRNPAQGLSPAVFLRAARVELPHPPVNAATVAVAGDAQPAVPGKPMASASVGARPAISTVLVDDSGALDPFFAALYRLESGKVEVVTILHYGDSPTTADLITGDARALLQQRFGDAGHGFNLVAKPWAWYGHRDVGISDHGWKALTGVGSMRQGEFGLGGATLVGGVGAKSTFRLQDASQTDMELDYFTEPDGGRVSIAADGVTLATIDTMGTADVPSFKWLHLPPGARQVELSVTSGEVRLHGIDLRKGDRGVLYDSLGLNGASTTVISRTFAAETWAAELRHAKPSLVIINYGTNESSFGDFVRKQYEGELRAAIAKLRAAQPDVPILIMGPMDRGERSGVNDIETMPTIPEITAIQRRVAADERCGFFDTFDAMGGEGTVARWYSAKPRLVTADFIHPTPQGALLVARELVNNLDKGYERWKHAQGIDVPVGSPATHAAPSAPSILPASLPANPSAAMPSVLPGGVVPSVPQNAH